MNLNNKHEEEDAEKLAPHLFSIEKKHAFEVPENYFEQLPHKMQDLVHQKQQPSMRFRGAYKLALAAAAVVLIVFVGSRFFHNPTGGQSTDSNELLANYASDYLKNTDESEVIEQLDETALVNAAEQCVDNSELSNDEIEDYLMNENIDVSTLDNEF